MVYLVVPIVLAAITFNDLGPLTQVRAFHHHQLIPIADADMLDAQFPSLRVLDHLARHGGDVHRDSVLGRDGHHAYQGADISASDLIQLVSVDVPRS